jgi:hypothetical protein
MVLNLLLLLLAVIVGAVVVETVVFNLPIHASSNLSPSLNEELIFSRKLPSF